MKVSYFGGLAAHLLAKHPDVAKVETLADAGVSGKDWHPGWLKVTMADGRSMVLCVVRQASNNETPGKPDVFRPEDLHDRAVERQVSGL